jgi:type I restriction enzyme, S subunit
LKSKLRLKEKSRKLFPEGWKERKIGDVCSIRRGASPRPIHKFMDNVGIPWVKISDATAQKTRFIEWTKQHIKEKGRDSTVIVKPNDLILSNSATPGIPKVMKITAAIHDGWLLLSDFNGVDSAFLYYLLKNERPNLIGIADGTVFKNLNISLVRNHKILVPTLVEQKNITTLLSYLDSQIENLQNQNKILQQINQSIFKSWFVDFDGQTEFVNSELGQIPKGWKVSVFSEIVEILSGGTPKTKILDYWNGQIKWVSIADTEQTPFIINTEKKITDLGVSKSNAKLLPSETIVITARGTVGNCSILSEPMSINQSCYGLEGKNNIGPYFLFVLLKQNLHLFQSNTHGSVFDTITRQTFDFIKIIVPNIELIQKYESVADSIFKNILKNQLQLINLTNIHDSLLPKLMSGELVN